MQIWNAGRVICTYNQYPYIVHPIMLLNFNKTYMDEVMKSIAAFAPDTFPANDPTFLANRGLDYRQRIAQKSNVIDMRAKPFIPPFETTKLIPSSTRWEFDLTLNSSQFCLKHGDANNPYKLQLLKAEMIITRLELSLEAASSVSRSLERERRLLYPFVDYKLNNFSLPLGQKEFRIQNTTMPAYPRRMFVFLVNELAMLGDSKECPFW